MLNFSTLPNWLRSVYAPDYLNGDPVPVDAFDEPGKFDIQQWIKTHGREHTRPPLDALIKGLQERGIAAFAATGYCKAVL